MRALLLSLLLLPAAAHAQFWPGGPGVAGGGGGGTRNLFFDAYDLAVTTTTTGSSVDINFSTYPYTANTVTQRNQCLVLRCAARWAPTANLNTLKIKWNNAGVQTVLGQISAANSDSIGIAEAQLCWLSHNSWVVTGSGGQGSSFNTGGGANVSGQTMAGGPNIVIDETAATNFICGCNDSGSGVQGKCAFESFRAKLESP